MENPWYKSWPDVYPKSLKYYEGSVVDFKEKILHQLKAIPLLESTSSKISWPNIRPIHPR